MSSNNNSGSLKGKFQDFGSAPSDGLWDNIADSLDEKKKKRVLIWWWFGGIAAVLLISFSMYQVGFHQGEISVANNEFDVIEKSDIQNDDQNNVPDIITSDEENQEIVTDSGVNDEIVAIDEKTNNESEQIVKKSDEDSSVPVFIDDIDLLPTISTFSNIEINRIEKTNIELKDLPEVEKIANTIEIPYWDSQKDSITDINDADEHVDLPWFYGFNLRTSKPITNSNYYQNGISSTALMDLNNFSSGGSSTVTNSGLAQESLGLTQEPVIESWVNKPLGIDFVIGKYFTKHLSWQSGLNFNVANYFTFYDGVDVQYAKTSVLSIGVPITLNFDLIKKESIKFSSGLGLVNEIPIVERITTSNYTSTMKESNFNIGFMGALQADLSAKIKIGKQLYLNMSPSYRWYYIQNLKSTHPLARKNHWLSGSLGLVLEI